MQDKRLTVVLVLAAVLLVLLNLPDPVSGRIKAFFRDGLAPLQSALRGMVHETREVFRHVRGLGGLAAENRRLAEELALVRNQMRALRTLEGENLALREQLAFKARHPGVLLAAEVIGRDSSGWWQTLRLNKGAQHGVRENLAVITQEGLVGKTVAVSRETSDILLLTDPNCKVAARVSRTGAFGVVVGGGVTLPGMCRMDFINKNLPVQPGDEILTSGLGGVFPKGLLVGYVEAAARDDAGLYQVAEIIPKADLGLLEYVFIMLPEPEDEPLPLEEDAP